MWHFPYLEEPSVRLHDKQEQCQRESAGFPSKALENGRSEDQVNSKNANNPAQQVRCATDAHSQRVAPQVAMRGSSTSL
jgi:hypothetical protein